MEGRLHKARPPAHPKGSITSYFKRTSEKEQAHEESAAGQPGHQVPAPKEEEVEHGAGLASQLMPAPPAAAAAADPPSAAATANQLVLAVKPVHRSVLSFRTFSPADPAAEHPPVSTAPLTSLQRHAVPAL